MSGESRKIHITRKGEQFGPYPEETARQFLTDGQLKATDLAWHDGADGWKPLPEVLGIAAAPDAPPPPPEPGAPPPEPAAPAGPPPDTIVHISRNGERHGPYKYETAKKYLAEGALKPTDSSWYEGLDGWKPLGELMGSAPAAGIPTPSPPTTANNCPQCSASLESNAIFCIQCGFNLQTGQGPQAMPFGTGMPGMVQQPAVQSTYSIAVEEEFKQSHLMYAGVAMIVGAAFPIYTGEGITFPNFDLSGASGKAILSSIWPLVVGITMVAMAKTTKDPVRCSVALGMSLFYILFIAFAELSIFNSSGAMGLGTSRGFGSLMAGGPMAIFYLGCFCLVMGCHARHMRPGNLPAYIISLVGGGFVCLNWLIPRGGSEIPLFAVFKSFDGSFFLGLTLLILMGAQIAAAVFCFTTTRNQKDFEIASKTMLSLRLYLGSYAAAMVLLFLSLSIDFLRFPGVGIGDKIKIIFAVFTLFLKGFTLYAGVIIAAPIASSCLLTRLMRR